MTQILVTGGAGYIGSHTVVALIEAGHKPIIVDNFSNSSSVVLDRIEKITQHRPELYQIDILDGDALDKVFKDHSISSVIHFAGLKAVGESVEQPLRYYRNNVQGSLELLRAMSDNDCYNIVFSSSASVYGATNGDPIKENAPRAATNPYGQSKLIVEDILQDLGRGDERWRISILRYFNPVAAHPSGLIGEDPNGIPNNLMPYIAQVGVGRLDVLSIFGDDYDTHDGTGVRDYIHVCDLADAHLKALAAAPARMGCGVYNIGTGEGYSVLDVLHAFERASGAQIPYTIKARRPGDVATSFADPSFTAAQLGWRARYDLDDMMRDHWRWQSANPQGYE